MFDTRGPILYCTQLHHFSRQNLPSRHTTIRHLLDRTEGFQYGDGVGKRQIAMANQDTA